MAEGKFWSCGPFPKLQVLESHFAYIDSLYFAAVHLKA